MTNPLLLLLPLAVLAVLLVREIVLRRRAERAAGTAVGQLRTLTASMREGVIGYDLRLQLVLVNPAFERLTGYPEEDIRDQEFLQYIHPDDRPAILAEWESLAEGGELRDQEYRVVTRGGQVRWSSSSWEPMRDQAGRQIGYLGAEFDITERKLAEAAMLEDTELFQAVLEVQQAVSAAGLDSGTVRDVICERSQRLTGASGAAIETVEGDEIVPQVYHGTPAPRLPLASSLSGLVIRSGELQRSDDTSTDPRIGHRGYTELGIRSVLAVPLKEDQRILGVLKVVSPVPHAFSNRDAKALRLLGGLAGAALGHASAYESRQSRLEERTQALQESEQRFKQLVDAAQDGVWMADDRGAITYANRRMTELLGYATGALLGQTIYDFLDPSIRPTAERVLMRGIHLPGESRDVRFRRRDGSDLWALVSASPITGRDGALVGTVGMLTDITDRRRGEERLRRSAERLAVLHDMDRAMLASRSPAELARAALARLRRLVPSERASLVVFDSARGEAHLLAGHAADAPLAGATLPLESLSPAETLRQGTVRYVEDLAALDDPAPGERRLLDEGIQSLLTVPLLVEGETIGELALAAATPSAFDGEQRDIVIEVAGPLAAALWQGRLRDDLTRRGDELERQAAERGAALRAATAELETLLYSVSHDLRAPLRHIGGFAQLLLDDCGPELDPAAREYAERIRQGADRMAGLVDGLVHLSRIGRQDLARRPVDLRALVEDLAGRYDGGAGAAGVGRHRIEWRVESLPSVSADPGLARLALAHLLDNAVKFSRTREPAIIGVRPVEREGQLGVAVTDNGVGFKTAYAGKLFGIFQRLHRSDEFEGDGAGLAVVQRIAHRHGGRVWAEGEADGGATFYITFGDGAAADA